MLYMTLAIDKMDRCILSNSACREHLPRRLTLEKTICILNIYDQLTSGKHGYTDDILKWYLHFLY